MFHWVLNTPWVLKSFWIDLVSRIGSERKVPKNARISKFEYSEDPLGAVLRTSWGCPKSISQGRPMNFRLGRPLDVIPKRPQDVRLGRPPDVRLGHPQDGQIGSLGDVLETWEGDVLGTSWGPIFAGWEMAVSVQLSSFVFRCKKMNGRLVQLQYFVFRCKKNEWLLEYTHFCCSLEYLS